MIHFTTIFFIRQGGIYSFVKLFQKMNTFLCKSTKQPFPLPFPVGEDEKSRAPKRPAHSLPLRGRGTACGG